MWFGEWSFFDPLKRVNVTGSCLRPTFEPKVLIRLRGIRCGAIVGPIPFRAYFCSTVKHVKTTLLFKGGKIQFDHVPESTFDPLLITTETTFAPFNA